MAVDLELLDDAEALKVKMANLDGLQAFAKLAKANGTQVMVFPEYGITGDGSQRSQDFTRKTVPPFLEPPPTVGSRPCGNLSLPAIARASCMAKDLEMVIVINILTKSLCKSGEEGCPKDGMWLHNTAIAFDEVGAVLSVYHKRHPYGDETEFVDPGDESMKGGVTFTTSFGVKFGMFICFDMLFFTDGGPDALEIVYPTDWVNNALGPIPEPLSARNAQRAWSAIHRKNLIAANYGGFGKNSSGSGIWHAGRELVSFYNPTERPSSKLLLAEVPVLTRADVLV